jgi:hypothetical protein
MDVRRHLNRYKLGMISFDALKTECIALGMGADDFTDDLRHQLESDIGAAQCHRLSAANDPRLPRGRAQGEETYRRGDPGHSDNDMGM